MSFVMDFTHELNQAQKTAVLTTEGPLLIVAGAGAGKTKTIVHRICHLVSTGSSPASILAVTFTNKAAMEMRERVLESLKLLPSSITENKIPFVSTFHRLGVFLLRKFGAQGGTIKHFTILDTDDSKVLIKEAMNELGLDPKIHDPRNIKNNISRAKNAMQNSVEFLNSANPNFRLTARVWDRYEKLKNSSKSLDFDDLLLETVTLLETNKDAKRWCQETWQYIHIDEYQDTNEVQYRIAKALAEKSKNICVVGDSDQSIYSWRGANIKNILEFEKDYPEAKVVLLEENYRSTKNVIAVANEIIEKNKFRTPKALFTNNNEGSKITLFTGYDENDEANYVIERVIEEIDKGVSPSDIAVLFRTNFQSRVLEEAFLNYSIPYQILGVRFFERKEIKDLLSYIKASLHPDSLIDIKRIINVPARGIGKVSVLKHFAEGKDSLSGRAKIAVDRFYEILEKISSYAQLHSSSDTLKYAIIESGLETFYKESAEGQERLENLRELVTIATRYDDLPASEGLEKLLEDAALVSDQDNIDNSKGVKLMTIHAAKGLEFKIVFVVGLEQGMFPHEKDSKLTGADAEEERRLMYVALTRAREKLYLTHASMRTIYGMRDIRMPSEFLIDISEELIVRDSREGESGFTIYL